MAVLPVLVFVWLGWRILLAWWFALWPAQAAAHGQRRLMAAPVARQRKPDWVVRELVRLKALMPDAGCRRVADMFNRCFAAQRQMSVSKSYVACVLTRERYAIEIERQRMRRKKPFSPAPNAVWAIDLTGKQDALGHVHSIVGIIDHGTRRLLKLNAPANKCAWTLLGCLFLAIGKYGKPKALRSDNERIFTGKVFQWGLRMAGIRHQRTELGCPWQNGRVERLFGTLKQKLDQWCVADRNQLNNALGRFAHWYNEVRPHQNIDGRTPMEAWTGIDPYRDKPKRAVWFEAWDGLLTGFHMRR